MDAENILVKHTFIHFPLPAASTVVQRHSSSPPTFQSEGMTERHSRNAGSSLVLVRGHYRSSACGSTIESKMSSEQATFAENDSTQKKKRTRPCRAKRLRYSRFVAKACTQIEEDPASFDLGSLMFPPSLVANAKKSQRFQAQMKWYQQQVLKGMKPTRFPENVEQLPASVTCKRSKPGMKMP